MRIHPEAVPDSSLTPAQPEPRIRPVPNRTATVDFAVVRTRAVGGAVSASAGSSCAGSGLELRNGAGAFAETRTFADGAWYVPLLTPDRYTL